MTDFERLKAQLGLGDETALEPVGAAKAPPASAMGFAAGKRPDDLDAIEGALRAPLWAGAALGYEDAIQARWWTGGHAPVLVVEFGDSDTAIAGDAVRLSDGRIVLGWCGGAGMARVHGELGEMAVSNDNGHAQLFELTPARTRGEVAPTAPPPAWMRGEVAPTAAPPALEVPPMERLRSYADADPWLRVLVDELIGRGSSESTAAAMGTLARLATPRQLEDAGAGAREVVAWCRTLSAEQRAALEARALDGAAAIRELLDGGDDAPSDEVQATIVTAIAHRRDELESVSLVLEEAGGGQALAEALAALDVAAESKIEELLASVRADERLARVAWCEPDAWWGLVGDYV